MEIIEGDFVICGNTVREGRSYNPSSSNLIENATLTLDNGVLTIVGDIVNEGVRLSEWVDTKNEIEDSDTYMGRFDFSDYFTGNKQRIVKAGWYIYKERTRKKITMTNFKLIRK